MARAGYAIRKASPALYALAKQDFQSGFKDEANKLLSDSQNGISTVLKAQAPEFLTLRAIDYTARSALLASLTSTSLLTLPQSRYQRSAAAPD
jgi:hypothetical protein